MKPLNDLENDLNDMVRQLAKYVNVGRPVDRLTVGGEPLTVLDVDLTKYIPLQKISYVAIHNRFLAIDCSTIPLNHANNWGIYLFRVAYALFEPPEKKIVKWGFFDKIRTLVDTSDKRRDMLQNERVEFESQTALNVLREFGLTSDDYLFLDGIGYFGGTRQFRVSLHDECERKGIRLIAISKNSKSLFDNKGRDLIAYLLRSTFLHLWAFQHPLLIENKNEHRYGDTYIAKFGSDSKVAFRSDIMGYLRKEDPATILSPLTSMAEDPTCEGYPAVLRQAHDFTQINSYAKRLEYYTAVEDKQRKADILDVLRSEETVASFTERLHGEKLFEETYVLV